MAEHAQCMGVWRWEIMASGLWLQSECFWVYLLCVLLMHTMSALPLWRGPELPADGHHIRWIIHIASNVSLGRTMLSILSWLYDASTQIRAWLRCASCPPKAVLCMQCAGVLSCPGRPSVPGLDSFSGAAFHSAEWDHSCDLTGKRVAVVGTGASAIQIIPKVQPLAKELYVFQRTPAWVFPR